MSRVACPILLPASLMAPNRDSEANDGAEDRQKTRTMVEVKAGEVDAAVEKHVPVVNVEGDYLVATVGEVLHPMTPEHLISNIWVEFSDGSAMKVTLTPEDKPEARFNIAGKKGKATVYEYCNLHGLWKAEVEL